MPLHIATPLLHSPSLSRACGRAVWLKVEAVQPCGSFKMRGIGHACEAGAASGALRFVSSSGGNAGLAVAHCGRLLGLPVTVVVPTSTGDRAKALIAEQGAEVVVRGASWAEADAHLRGLLGPGDAYIHPFDDPLLWTGHATLVDEIAAAGLRPGAVVLSVGGGGLMCGAIEGLRRNGWDDVAVLAVETRGADSLARSLSAGERIVLPAIDSIATSLGARQVSQRAFDEARGRHPVRSVVVTDAEAVDGCLALAREHRLIVEPACGASMVPAMRDDAALGDAETVVVVACGGVSATYEQLRSWQAGLPRSAA
ncbi:MAG: pyridoxal-phosphate dependent enzyme [Burkholderiaceae bacterium]